MKKIRIKNDIRISWGITVNGSKISLSSCKNLIVQLVVFNDVISVKEYTLTENVITFSFLGKNQTKCGLYTLICQYSDESGALHTIDKTDAFVLVPHTNEEGGSDNPKVALEVVQLSTDIDSTTIGKAATINIIGTNTLEPEESAYVRNTGTENDAELTFGIPRGKNGLTAYEVAVKQGYSGTKDEWIKSLKASLNYVLDNLDKSSLGKGELPSDGGFPYYNGKNWVWQGIGFDEESLAKYLEKNSYATKVWVLSQGFSSGGDSSGGINESTLRAYLIRNGYAKKTDIPDSWWGQTKDEDNIVKGALSNILSLLFEGDTTVLDGVAKDGTATDSKTKIVTPYFGNTHYLSKTTADTASGHITFKQGLTADGTVKANQGATFGEYVKSNDYDDATQTGWGIVQRKDGKYSLNVTDLSVWGKAVFNNLTIRELSYVGGNLVFSPAASKIFAVKEVYGKNDETEEQELKGWKCYLLADDGTTATTNSWAVDDQARCETFNIKEGVYENVSNKTYWRRITKVSSENEVITDDDGNVLYDGKKFAWIQMSKIDCMENSDIPAAGDSIVLEGNRTNTDRQNFVLKETWGDDAPREIGYTGINSYSLTDKWVYEVGPKRVRFATQYFAVISRSGDKVYTPNYRGTYSSSFTYYYYDEVTWMGTRWLCVVPEGGSTTTEPSENNEYWKATTAIIATKLELEHDLFSGIAKGETHTVTCKLMLGDTDCTKAVSYWGVTRKTDDSTSDAAWATKDKVKNFSGSIDITWSNDGTEDDIGDGDMATFTFTAKTTTGDIYQQVLSI